MVFTKELRAGSARRQEVKEHSKNSRQEWKLQDKGVKHINGRFLGFEEAFNLGNG